VNLLNSKFRRTTALVAGSFLGLVGVVALSAPASAHAPRVDATTECSDGGWTVHWTAQNDYNQDATVSGVELDGIPVEGGIGDIKIGKSVKASFAETLKGDSLLKPQQDKATLVVKLHWDGWGDNTASKTIDRPADCPTASPSASTSTSAIPSDSASPSPSETTPTLPVPTPSSSTEVGLPSLDIAEDCTTMTFTVDNPKNGIEFALNFKSSKGEERNDTFKPGDKKSEKFSATEGFNVVLTVTVDGEKQTPDTFTYKKPADCDTSGNGGGLPVTGAAAGGIAGGAAALLAAGIVLFVMARRRKVKFTA
jgi:hypothetical protein